MKLLSVDPQDLAGTMTSIVTITRGEHVKRHYSKQQAEGNRLWKINGPACRAFGTYH